MSFKKSILIFAVISTVLSGLLLIGPRVPDEKQEEACVVNVDLPSIFGLSMNCDSPEFLLVTEDPRLLLKEKSVRQSRPGIIYATYLISLPLRPLNLLMKGFVPEVKREVDGKTEKPFTDYFSSFLAYAFFNFVFVLLSFGLFFSLFKNEEGKINIWMFLSSFLLFFNPVVIDWLWSPHSQIFNLFAPIFCVWVAYETWTNKLFEDKNIYWLAFVVGLGVTAYQTFALFLPALFISAFFKRKDLKKFIFKSVIISVLVFLPYIFWILFVKWKVGFYYNHEAVVYKQLVWIFDQGIFQTIFKLFLNFFRIIWIAFKHNWFLITPCLLLILLWFKKLEQKRKILILISILISISFSAFFALIGYFNERIVFTGVVPFFVLVAIILEELSNLKKIDRISK